MQQLTDAAGTNSLPAAVELAWPPPPVRTSRATSLHYFSGQSNTRAGSQISPASYNGSIQSVVVSELHASTETVPHRSLPSLLQYVDNTLMHNSNSHNNPPDDKQSCISCRRQWDLVSISSTFLPLSPCNHWIHYRCLIWLATREDSNQDKCPECKTQLFEWDGISALTLATRTSLPMGNEQFNSTNLDTAIQNTSDRADYERDCRLIIEFIARSFSIELARPSGYMDGSPDLVHCYDSVLNDLKVTGRPHATWLKWSTTTGSLLFGNLVAIKMRRYLSDTQPWVERTEAWTNWEAGCMSLQRQLLNDVHKQ